MDSGERTFLVGHGARITAVAAGPTGARAWSADASGLLVMWDLDVARRNPDTTHSQLAGCGTAKVHNSFVIGLAVAADGSTLYSLEADRSGSVGVWNISPDGLTLQTLISLAAEGTPRQILAFGDGSTLLVLEEAQLHFFALGGSPGSLIPRQRSSSSLSLSAPFVGAAIVPDLDLLAVLTATGRLLIVDSACSVLNAMATDQNLVSLSAGTDSLYLGTAEGSVLIYSASSLTVHTVVGYADTRPSVEVPIGLAVPARQSSKAAVAVVPSGDRSKLLVAYKDGSLVLVDLLADQVVGHVLAHSGPAVELACAGAASASWWTALGSVSVGLDGSVAAWSHSGVLLRLFQGPKTPIVVSVSPASPWLAVGYSDGRVVVMQARDGQLAAQVPQQDGPVVAAAWSPSGRTLGVLWESGLVSLIDSEGWAPVGGLPPPPQARPGIAGPSGVSYLGFVSAAPSAVAEDRLVALVVREGTHVGIYQIEQSSVSLDRVVTPLAAYSLPSPVAGAAVHPSGTHGLVVTSDAIYYFNLQTGRELGSVLVPRHLETPPSPFRHTVDVAVDPTGLYLAVLSVFASKPSSRYTLLLYEIGTGVCLGEQSGLPPLTSLVWDGSGLVGSGADGTLSIWTLRADIQANLTAVRSAQQAAGSVIAFWASFPLLVEASPSSPLTDPAAYSHSIAAAGVAGVRPEARTGPAVPLIQPQSAADFQVPATRTSSDSVYERRASVGKPNLPVGQSEFFTSSHSQQQFVSPLAPPPLSVHGAAPTPVWTGGEHGLDGPTSVGPSAAGAVPSVRSAGVQVSPQSEPARQRSGLSPWSHWSPEGRSLPMYVPYYPTMAAVAGHEPRGSYAVARKPDRNPHSDQVLVWAGSGRTWSPGPVKQASIDPPEPGSAAIPARWPGSHPMDRPRSALALPKTSRLVPVVRAHPSARVIRAGACGDGLSEPTRPQAAVEAAETYLALNEFDARVLGDIESVGSESELERKVGLEAVPQLEPEPEPEPT